MNKKMKMINQIVKKMINQIVMKMMNILKIPQRKNKMLVKNNNNRKELDCKFQRINLYLKKVRKMKIRRKILLSFRKQIVLRS